MIQNLHNSTIKLETLGVINGMEDIYLQYGGIMSVKENIFWLLTKKVID